MAQEADQRWLDRHLTHDVESLHNRPSGVIYRLRRRGSIFPRRSSASALSAASPAPRCCPPPCWITSASRDSIADPAGPGAKSAIVTPSLHRLSEPVHEIVVSSPWRNRSQRCRVIQRPCPNAPDAARRRSGARARRTAAPAPFDKVFCSEQARTGTTADLLLGDRAIPRERHPALNEMFFGDWEMRHHRDLQREDAENYAARCADWQHAAPPTAKAFRILPAASASLSQR